MKEEAFRHALHHLDITETEIDVLKLICGGYTNGRIADIRGTTEVAVEKVARRLRKYMKVEKNDLNPRMVLVNKVWGLAWDSIREEKEDE
jgi:DNA-binding CsgD family transcriptional regulator